MGELAKKAVPGGPPLVTGMRFGRMVLYTTQSVPHFQVSRIARDNGRFVHVLNFLPTVVQFAFYSFAWHSDSLGYSILC